MNRYAIFLDHQGEVIHTRDTWDVTDELPEPRITWGGECRWYGEAVDYPHALTAALAWRRRELNKGHALCR